MTATCPAGHRSEAEDYCDVCGAPIDTAARTSSPAAPEAPAPELATPGTAEQGLGPQTCPNCGLQNLPEALFCEGCGYDFTTGTMPRSAGPAPEAAATSAVQTPPAVAAPPADGGAAEAGATPPPTAGVDWVVEVWVDPDWYQAQESPDPMPSPGLPEVIPLRARSALIGRKSRSRNINPDVDCETDTGISRRQAQLTSDGSRWWVEDLDSSNGTFVGPASGPLPTDPIPVGPKHELDADDRVYVGAWTRLVIRPATDEEKATL
ncbi:hypothetical protein GCM10009841_28630 [Microlunatus panaciterrae]|uniref:FHA domain-containing protein n=1 Tax=Microlunatus panaciterrae TaxID=400768 RepID=A0ABS2RFQ7_9ACTN|nr:FHA domain-containing protein [Microlunatus panaciterrae]MBM7797523.1 hypothetical protein [Microlunatus panaciterrae]